MGNENSSVTRVWPVFDTLFATDPTGTTWLKELLRLATGFPDVTPGILLPDLSKFDGKLPRNLASVLGGDRAERLGNLRSCFERDYPPPPFFLRWLIQSPTELTWPTVGRPGSKVRLPKKFSEKTRRLRTSLIAGDKSARDAALHALNAKGAKGSRRKWWAFEGFTSVDCVLETDNLLVFVEGKRTEPISIATEWYPQRNQIVRNVEVASATAAELGKDFGVILCAESHMDLPEQAFIDGLPHMSPKERKDLQSHYWGCVTWQQLVYKLCPSLKLPDNLDEAVRICERLRP